MKNILALYLLYILSSFQLFAAEEFPQIDSSKISEMHFVKRVVHLNKDSISSGIKLRNVGLIYAAQWAYYIPGQWETIQEHGSFKNWYSNMPKLHFDKDSYDYNLILHTLTGNYYYHFFRSQGYSKQSSVTWAFLSHLMFEFTVETVTEAPSVQDIYQTPVLGALLGMSTEYLGLKLINSDFIPAQVIGYALCPFALFPFTSYKVVSLPTLSSTYVGYQFIAQF
ncbi:MAG: DUF3943 domain-containing protein [Fibrobacterales bacterium]